MRHVITTTAIMGYHIKVWEQCIGSPIGPNHAITVALRGAVVGGEGNYHVSPTAIDEALCAIPSVVAWEVTNALGNGYRMEP
jgi:hypothetical protein